MSPRPLPKISLRHDWTKEFGSKVVQQPEGETVRQPEGEVVRQTKFFQSTQPTPNPIRDRSGRPDDMQDERKTSRSQEINVYSFNEELSSSDRTGRPVGAEEIQTRSSEDSKSLNVEQTHDRTGRLVTDTAAVQDDSQVYHEADTLSTLMKKYFVKEWRNPLLFMTKIMNQWWWTRQTWTSKFQDYHIPLWNTRKVPAFENWFRKLRTTQIDMLFNKTYDRINHLILSVQSQNKWFGMLGTSNYVNYSRRNPKRSAMYVYHTGTLASSIAHAGTSCVKEEARIRNSSSIRWTFFRFRSTSSRKDDLTDIDMVRRLYGQPVEEEVQEEVLPGHPW